jgi:hypothetical protein
MKRILVMANNSHLADAIASSLAEDISPEATHVTHYELDRETHPSLVMVLDEGNLRSESIFCSFYSSPFKTQEREKRDANDLIWTICRI